MDEKFGKPLMLVLDTTGSMSSSIELIRSYFTHFLVRYAMDEMPSRIGFVLFDDHATDATRESAVGDRSLRWREATDDLEALIFDLRTSDIYGHGFDDAENIACAVAKARELEPEAVIWLVTDALPHGVKGYHRDEKYGGSSGSDAHYDGCPCGVRLDLTGVNVLLVADNNVGAYARFFGFDLSQWDVHRWYRDHVDNVVVVRAGDLRSKLAKRDGVEETEEELV